MSRTNGSGSPVTVPVPALEGCSMELREAISADARLLFDWANDLGVRRMAFHQEPIAWGYHVRWLSRKLADPNTRIFIAVDASGVPVGQIRFDIAQSHAEVDVHVAPRCRQRGLGAAIIAAGTEILFQDKGISQVTAIVKSENLASIKAFCKAGFKIAGQSAFHGFPCHTLVAENL